MIFHPHEVRRPLPAKNDALVGRGAASYYRSEPKGGNCMYDGHLVVDSDSHIREYWDFDRTYKDNIDPEYREQYARLSEAVKARQKRPGDVGLGDLLWPRRTHPMGIYDTFLAEPREPRQQTNGAPG